MPINFDHHKVELNWGGQPLTLETGKIARQADGAVLATLGETVLLATVVSAKSPKPGQDFFPLTVNYQEKYFAAGKIPGGYFKREGRPTENETLVSRLIDGQYPNYQSVLPASHSTRAVLDREELLRAVRPAALIAHESANTVAV